MQQFVFKREFSFLFDAVKTGNVQIQNKKYSRLKKLSGKKEKKTEEKIT